MGFLVDMQVIREVIVYRSPSEALHKKCRQLLHQVKRIEYVIYLKADIRSEKAKKNNLIDE